MEKAKEYFLKIIKDKRIYILLFSMLCVFTVFLIARSRITQPSSYTIYSGDDSTENLITIKSNEKYKQVVKLGDYKSVTQFTVYVQKPEMLHNKTFLMDVTDKNGKILWNGELNIDDQLSVDSISFPTAINLDETNEELTLEFSLKDSKDSVTLQGNADGNLRIDCKSADATRFQLFALRLLKCLMAFIAIIFIVYLYFNVKIEYIYVICVIVFGTVISLLIPIYCVPDEYIHINNAMLNSDKLMQIEWDGENIPFRQDDLDNVYYCENLNASFLNNYYKDMQQIKATNTTINYESNRHLHSAPGYLYAASTLGITLGRLLGLSTIWTIMLGRWFNLILFAAVGFCCIKKMPVFKEVIFFLSMIPMLLQQVASISYDSIVITLSIYIIAQTIRLLFGEKLSKVEIGSLVVLGYLLYNAKGHAYFTVAILPLLYLLKKYWNKIVEFFKKYLKFIIPVCCGCALLVVFYIFKQRNIANERSLMYLLSHPTILYAFIRETAYVHIVDYFSSMFCNTMGLVYIQVQTVLIIMYAVLFFLMITREKEENTEKLPVYIKIIFVLLFLVSFFGIWYSQYNWSFDYHLSSIRSYVVEGVQGRYFLPVLPLLMMGVSKYAYKQEDDRMKILNYTTIILTVFTIMNLLLYFAERG